MKYAMALLAALLCGCSAEAPQSSTDPTRAVEETKLQAAVKAVTPSPFGKRWHGHPTVAKWYYETHQHPFNCRDAPEHDYYDCASCPVGKPDRVITLPHGEYQDIPGHPGSMRGPNEFFGCEAINMLVPEPSSEVWSDSFYCRRSPQDGYIVLNGEKISCAEQDPGKSENLGTIEPGETKEITVQ